MRPYTTDKQPTNAFDLQQPQHNAYTSRFQDEVSGHQYSGLPNQADPFVSSYPQSPRRSAPLTPVRSSSIGGPRRKRTRFSFALAEGWSVLILLFIAVYAVADSIIAAQWVSQSSWLFD